LKKSATPRCCSPLGALEGRLSRPVLIHA
jgi:hypothetical protein